jgi:hypothetical protein
VYDQALGALNRTRFRLYGLERADPGAPPRKPNDDERTPLKHAVEELFVVQQQIEARVPVLAGDREQYTEVSPALILERAAQSSVP